MLTVCLNEWEIIEITSFITRYIEIHIVFTVYSGQRKSKWNARMHWLLHAAVRNLWLFSYCAALHQMQCKSVRSNRTRDFVLADWHSVWRFAQGYDCVCVSVSMPMFVGKKKRVNDEMDLHTHERANATIILSFICIACLMHEWLWNKNVMNWCVRWMIVTQSIENYILCEHHALE